MFAKPLFGVILTLLLGASSFAAPQERTQETLTRSAQTGNSVRTELSQNVYRQEPYQAEYTVQVPYEAQETYYESVPYQVEETYYEDVPYTERVPYTDYEEYYDNEYVCRNVTRYRQECHNERVCAPGGRRCEDVTECGTISRGERICKTRTVCSDNGPRECRDIPRCQQVPYTDRECGWQTVRKTRPVTRYRDEVRYRKELRKRTVTKYRQEERTRTVTKYREEARCCVTKYRDVFDHQFTQPVTIVFPTEASLLANEQERIQVALTGNENNPQVSVQVQSDIFSYEVEQTRQEGRDKVLVLKVVPKWTGTNAGSATVQGFKLSFIKNQGRITFKETISSKRLTTVYTLEVRDTQGQNLVFEHRFESSDAKTFEVETPELNRSGKYALLLKVERHGINVVQGSLTFEQTGFYEKKELDSDEVQSLRNENQVRLLNIEGLGAERTVLFQDLTPAVEEVKTTYKLVVWKKLSNGKIEWLNEKTFSREEIQRADGLLGIAFKSLGLSPASDQKLYMDLVVRRESPQYLGTQKVQFIVNKTF
ncbi:MAG: hypothetical protein KUL82_07645 [Bdellovibrio sp.]|nr:hypothetical protein [Bdellovibrio sp.]